MLCAFTKIKKFNKRESAFIGGFIAMVLLMIISVPFGNVELFKAAATFAFVNVVAFSFSR